MDSIKDAAINGAAGSLGTIGNAITLVAPFISDDSLYGAIYSVTDPGLYPLGKWIGS